MGSWKKRCCNLEQAGMGEENKVGCGCLLLEEVELEPAEEGLGLLFTKRLRTVFFGFACVPLRVGDTRIWAGRTKDRHDFTEDILF